MNDLDLGKVVGSKIHHVEGTPGAELGLENDWALDTASGNVYEKTEAGWQLRGSFKGDKGEQGIQGPKGDTGDTGPQGPAGAAGADGKTPTFTINDAGHLIATFTETE